MPRPHCAPARCATRSSIDWSARSASPLAERDPPRHLRRADHRHSRGARRALDRDRHSRGARARQARLLSLDGVPARAAVSSMRCPRSRTGCSRKCARRSSRSATISSASPPRKRIPGSATAVSAGSPPASSIRSRRSATPRPATAFATTTASSRRSSARTARSAKSRAPGSAFHNFWESGHGGVRYRVRFGGHCQATRDEQGRMRYEWVDTQDVWAVGYDLLIPGNRSPTVNHLRLWSGRGDHAVQDRGVQRRQLRRRGRRADRREESVARAVSGRFDAAGQGAALQAAVLLRQRFAPGHARAASRRSAASSRICRSAIAIQLNDTHPALTVVELMRLLVDVYDLEWADARGSITREVCSYTNHTLLPEALETWPIASLRAAPAAPSADRLPDQPRLSRRGERAAIRTTSIAAGACR